MAILTHYLGAVAKAQIERRMEKAVPDIVSGMIAKGMTPERAPLDLVIRDALFRLIRSIVPSGDISDFIRDRSQSDVIKRVMGLSAAPEGLAGLVKATAHAFVEMLF